MTDAAAPNTTPPATWPEAPILAVDDQKVNLLVVERVLRAAGYVDVSIESDSRRVLESCVARRYALMLLDINMPFLDGYGVLAQLQELPEDQRPAVLVLTAQHGDEVKCLSAGAHDFVTKPFDQAVLLNRVGNLARSRQLLEMVRAQNEVLEHKVQERTRELEHSRIDILRRLGRAAEFRDNETGNHVVRMAEHSAIIAREMGFAEVECQRLRVTATMHDVGKIAIPDAILLKPGKLDPVEWEVMKTHAARGADLLAEGGSDLMQEAAEIALCHHEKWDGSGYPSGLHAEQIPLAARVVACADVFDALMSPRPYKPAWKLEDTVALIHEQSGRHFDPAVVAAFDRTLDAVLAMREKYRDEVTLMDRDLGQI